MTRAAGYFLLLSALLHLVGTALAWGAPVALFLLGPAALYMALFAGLVRGLLWVAWVAFVCMLGGMAGTVVELVRSSAVPDPVLWAILLADAAAAMILFAALWAGPEADEA